MWIPSWRCEATDRRAARRVRHNSGPRGAKVIVPWVAGDETKEVAASGRKSRDARQTVRPPRGVAAFSGENSARCSAWRRKDGKCAGYRATDEVVARLEQHPREQGRTQRSSRARPRARMASVSSGCHIGAIRAPRRSNAREGASDLELVVPRAPRLHAEHPAPRGQRLRELSAITFQFPISY